MEMVVCACIVSDLNMQDILVLCLFPVGAKYNIEHGMTV